MSKSVCFICCNFSAFMKMKTECAIVTSVFIFVHHRKHCKLHIELHFAFDHLFETVVFTSCAKRALRRSRCVLLRETLTGQVNHVTTQCQTHVCTTLCLFFYFTNPYSGRLKWTQYFHIVARLIPSFICIITML